MAGKANTNEVNKGTEVPLENGSVVYVRPLTLKRLRAFMKVMKKVNADMETQEFDDEEIDILIEAARIALARDYEDIAEDENLDDLLNMQSVNKILSAAMGADLNE